MVKSALFFALFTALTGSNCGLVDKIPDINCDGQLIISVTGDSLVSGYDSTAKKNLGGYVKRLGTMLKGATVNNLGKQGMFALDLVKILSDGFAQPDSAISKALLASDYVIIDAGRNDRWFFGPPIKTYRNLKRAAGMIRTKVYEKTGVTPYVVIANLMLPNRGSQGPWVKELNAYILAGDSINNPSDLRFDLVSKRLLGPDRIHPSPQGYTALAKSLYRYLTVTVQARLAKITPAAG